MQLRHFHCDFWSVVLTHELLGASAPVAPEMLQNLLCNRSTIPCWFRALSLRSFAITLFILILPSPDFQAEQISVSDTPTLSACTVLKLPSWAQSSDSAAFNTAITFSLASTHQLSNTQRTQKRLSKHQCWGASLLRSLGWIPLLSQFS